MGNPYRSSCKALTPPRVVLQGAPGCATCTSGSVRPLPPAPATDTLFSMPYVVRDTASGCIKFKYGLPSDTMALITSGVRLIRYVVHDTGARGVLLISKTATPLSVTLHGTGQPLTRAAIPPLRPALP